MDINQHIQGECSCYDNMLSRHTHLIHPKNPTINDINDPDKKNSIKHREVGYLLATMDKTYKSLPVNFIAV